ncbi:MAG: ABC transporter ATP-binding protein [Desulfarculaceae bacterium]|jgi:branched-chain amino acid transport system ATP-binding protein
MSTAPLLQISNLEVRYGEFQAIRDITLHVDQGEIVSIIGSNGAGKSTLLKTITGALPPYTGEILHHGENIKKLKPYEIVSQGIAMVPEGRRIFSRLTVLENLQIGSYTARARKNQENALKQVYKLFPILKERCNQLGANLSGGEQQMLAIGRSLMSTPSLVLFDEISLGLAPLIIKDIYKTIGEINQAGTTMVLVEQDVQRSLKAANRAYILQEGRVTLEGNPDDMSEEQVKKAYFGV